MVVLTILLSWFLIGSSRKSHLRELAEARNFIGVEDYFLEHFDTFRDSREAVGHLHDALEQHREVAGTPILYQHNFDLILSRWVGTIEHATSRFSQSWELIIENALDGFFSGKMRVGEGSRFVKIYGLYDGNHLLFIDDAKIGKTGDAGFAAQKNMRSSKSSA